MVRVMMSMNVMISYCLSAMLPYSLLQISMNVQQELISVSRFAVTPLDLTRVAATVGLSLMPMEEHVMVSSRCGSLCEL